MQYENDIYEKYMKMHPDANPEKVRQIIINITEKRMKNIPVKMHNNVTHEWLDTSMLDVFDWIDQRDRLPL